MPQARRILRFTLAAASWLLLAIAAASAFVSYRHRSPVSQSGSSWAISGGVLEITVYDPIPLLGGIPILGHLFRTPAPVPEGFSQTPPHLHFTLATYPSVTGRPRGLLWWDFTPQSTGSRTAFAIVFWPLPVAAATLTWWLARRDRRFPAGTCPACGYDLHTLPSDAPCPECGARRASAHKHVPTASP